MHWAIWSAMLALVAHEHSFVHVRAEGVLTGNDYRSFEPGFANEVAHRGKPLPLLLDLLGFRGWTPGGLLRDIFFDLRHRATFSRIAVIGEKRWHKWITYAASPVFRGTLGFFRPAAERVAVEWLQQASQAVEGAS